MLALTEVASSTYYERKQRQNRVQPASDEERVIPRRGRPETTHSLTYSGEIVSNAQIKEWLMELIAGEAHIYGYVLLTKCLQEQYALDINQKKTYRLCKQLGILQPQRRKLIHYPRQLARNAIITGPNQQWQLDIKYGYIAGYDRFFYIADMIDVFDRTLVGYHMGSSCQAKEVCTMVENALVARSISANASLTIRTDNGPQFVSQVFGKLFEVDHLRHERIPPKTPNMNAYIESFHATLERDLLRKEIYATFQEAYASVTNYIEFYNHRRMHRSLGKRSPVHFAAWAQTQQAEQLEMYYRKV